ncbi:SCA7 domain-containing protein [Fusarium sp. LHS14.1]|nr:SCA7 domain-containing protein [Fusarium sp. LHS14.1]
MAKRTARQEQARKKDEGKGEGKGDDCNCNDNDDNIAAGKKAAESKTGKEAAGNKSDDDKKGKRRKADGDPDTGPKTKKKKDEPKAKVPKPRGPVDADLQCGVMLTNSQPCARSLACKKHSMRAKRAVAGRTLPYDMLLDTYRKEKQAKQQEALLKLLWRTKARQKMNQSVGLAEETTVGMDPLVHWKPMPVLSQISTHRSVIELARGCVELSVMVP